MKPQLKLSLKSLALISAVLFFGAAKTTLAANDGPYVGVAGEVSLGPGSVSYPGNLYNLANDGRFSYGASAGYIYKNFGLELKYQDLGSQHQTGLNGAPVNTGNFSGKYYGVNGLYFIPVNEGKQDFYLGIGAGSLQTKLETTSLSTSQSELALNLALGVRVNLTNNFAVTGEVNHITPVSHGIRTTGLYNTGFTVISLGLVAGF